jgi:hypothetical protein
LRFELAGAGYPLRTARSPIICMSTLRAELFPAQIVEDVSATS